MRPLAADDPTSVGEGRYRLIGRLGQGGMGVVYLGRSPSGRAVAVKVVRPELSTEPGFRRRFADEVAAARRIGGFHTAPVVDADPQGEPAWLVTAFVPGPTLQALLAQVGALPTHTLTVLAAGLAEALEAIHRAGVIHRDFKPANIIIAEDGPRVIDFGIARALDGTALTQTGLQIGTPGFLAPEQLSGGVVTPAVDMFALGVVLSQAAGGSPFGDGPSVARHYRVVHEEPDLDGVPDELRGIVAGCLAKDPRERLTPAALIAGLTVHHRADGQWLPAEATGLIDRQDPRLPDGPSGGVSGAVPREPSASGPNRSAGTEQPEWSHTAPAPASAPEVSDTPPAGRDPQPGPTPVPPTPSYGPAPVMSDSPLPAPGTDPTRVGSPDAHARPGRDPGPRPGTGPRRGRRRTTVGAAVLVAAAVVTGLLVLHPWSGASPGAGAEGTGTTAAPLSSASSSASTATAPSGPAAFPTAPLLVRLDTAPGWPAQCHGVIALRGSSTDDSRQIVPGSNCDTLPQWSPDRHSFAFTRRTAQETAVWTANADGSGARRIAAIAGGRVSWSPDGTRLAVLRKQDGVQQLFAVTVTDGSAQQLTTGDSAVEDPAWSPDGKRIVVSIQAQHSLWQLFLVDPSAPGSAPKQLTSFTHSALDAVWSPDGRYFAYTAGQYGVGTQGDIRLVGTDGLGDRAVVATAAHEMDPGWSADGSWIAFVRGVYAEPVVWAVRPDGTGARRLTTGTTSEGQPAWR